MHLSRGDGRGGINIHVLKPIITPECSYDRTDMAPTSPATVITFPVRNTDSKNITTSMFHRMPGVYETPQLKPLSDFPPIAPQLVSTA